MTTTPKVTVLMPVYNCEAYVGEAIDSILGQSFTDFECLIIDDASTDKTVSIVKGYSDSRIKFIRKPENTGYTNSLNYGLTIAQGEYIARMDGDDISLPERFAKQVTFMDAYPEVVACGTTYSIIGSGIIKKVPINHGDIKVQLLQKTCFGHPTVMLRKAVFEKFKVAYNSDREPAEDYDLWVRLLKYGKLANLPEVLLSYRVHDGQVSVKNIKKKFDNYYIIKKNILNYLDAPLTEVEMNLLDRIICRQIISYEEFEVFKTIKKKFLIANRSGVFKSSGFDDYLQDMERLLLKDYFYNRTSYFPFLLSHYHRLNKTFNFKLSIKERVKLFVKSVIYFKK
ncbi:glycosyltransferase family 2 protein [Bizionia sp.]|uniref:glycosyltransferase family 2 protein n=1 Tax=Bizionia sp. TaxID=1954480 RepID=UPI003A925A99